MGEMIAGTVVIERPDSSLFCSAKLLRTASKGNEGSSIVLLRFILHDWPHEFCVVIRSICGPDTKLLVIV